MYYIYEIPSVSCMNRLQPSTRGLRDWVMADKLSEDLAQRLSSEGREDWIELRTVVLHSLITTLFRRYMLRMHHYYPLSPV